MASVVPNRGKRLIGSFAFAMLIALIVAVAIYTGFHRFLFFVGTGLLGTAVGWFLWKVSRERPFTAGLFALLTVGVVLVRDWFMAGILVLGLVTLTVLRHLPGLASLEMDSKRRGA